MNPPSCHSPRRRRAAICAALAGAITIGVVVAGPSSVSAAGPNTSDPAIAARADRALQALDRWEASGRPADYVAYVRLRDRTADGIAIDLGVEPSAMSMAWAEADLAKQHAVLAAASQLGVPYRSLASEPGVAFDCSGLTIWAFSEASVDIPRVSGDQIRASEEVDLAEAEPGDLMYYPGHVGIYLGADSYLHSPYTGADVQATRLPDRSVTFGDIVATSDEATSAAS